MLTHQEQKLVVLKLYDRQIDVERLYLVKVSKLMTQEKLEKIISAIKNLYNEADFDDWSYDDVIDTLEHLCVAKQLSVEQFSIEL